MFVHEKNLKESSKGKQNLPNVIKNYVISSKSQGLRSIYKNRFCFYMLAINNWKQTFQNNRMKT